MLVSGTPPRAHSAVEAEHRLCIAGGASIVVGNCKATMKGLWRPTTSSPITDGGEGGGSGDGGEGGGGSPAGGCGRGGLCVDMAETGMHRPAISTVRRTGGATGVSRSAAGQRAGAVVGSFLAVTGSSFIGAGRFVRSKKCMCGRVKELSQRSMQWEGRAPSWSKVAPSGVRDELRLGLRWSEWSGGRHRVFELPVEL